MINKIDVIKLYQEGKITKYVLERELSELTGERTVVSISESEPASSGVSYAIFLAPEKRIDGLFLNIIIDNNALIRYIPEKLETVLVGIKRMIQRVFSEFTTTTFSKNAVTLSMVLKTYLEIYKKYYEYLDIELLPEMKDIDDVINELDTEMNVSSAIERIRVDKLMPIEVIDIAKEATHDVISITMTDTTADNPIMNMWRAERMKYCNGTSTDIGHTEIRYDYKPSTNQ